MIIKEITHKISDYESSIEISITTTDSNYHIDFLEASKPQALFTTKL